MSRLAHHRLPVKVMILVEPLAKEPVVKIVAKMTDLVVTVKIGTKMMDTVEA